MMRACSICFALVALLFGAAGTAEAGVHVGVGFGGVAHRGFFRPGVNLHLGGFHNNGFLRFNRVFVPPPVVNINRTFIQGGYNVPPVQLPNVGYYHQQNALFAAPAPCAGPPATYSYGNVGVGMGCGGVQLRGGAVYGNGGGGGVLSETTETVQPDGTRTLVRRVFQ